MGIKFVINFLLEMDRYPILKPQYLLMKLVREAGFLHLDCSSAVNRVPGAAAEKVLQQGNHMRSYLGTKDFLMGVTSAPAVFQSKTDQVLQEVNGVACYLDDIQTLGGIERNIYTIWRKF